MEERFVDLSKGVLETVGVDSVLEVGLAYYQVGFVVVVDRVRPNFVAIVDIEKVGSKSHLVPPEVVEFVVVDQAGFAVVPQKLVVYFAKVQIIDLPSN